MHSVCAMQAKLAATSSSASGPAVPAAIAPVCRSTRSTGALLRRQALSRNTSTDHVPICGLGSSNTPTRHPLMSQVECPDASAGLSGHRPEPLDRVLHVGPPPARQTIAQTAALPGQAHHPIRTPWFPCSPSDLVGRTRCGDLRVSVPGPGYAAADGRDGIGIDQLGRAR
jgi:hypothetical protein